MKVTYIGPHDAATLEDATSGVTLTCEHGGSIDVPDELAGRLTAEQPSNWRLTSAAARKRQQAGEGEPGTPETPQTPTEATDSTTIEGGAPAEEGTT